MKKKLFLSILTLFMFSVCLIRVNAAEPLFSVGWELEPATPKLDNKGNLILPADDKTYGTTAAEFDFSAVKFLDTSGNVVSGDQWLQKIIIGELGTITGNASAKKQSGETNEQYVNRLLNNYFTGYCLDKSKMYPQYGLFNNNAYADGVKADGSYNADVEDPIKFRGAIIRAAVMNDPVFENIATKLLEEFNGDISGIQMISDDGYEAESIPAGNIDNFGPNFMGDTSAPEIKIGISYIGFKKLLDDTKQVYFVTNNATRDYITGAHPGASVYYLTGEQYSSDYYPLKTNLSELAFQKYKKSTAGKNYVHALWIVENSFPTLDVDTTLSLAGVNKADFDAKIKSLFPASATANAEQFAQYEKMVMFGIVQYAVWQSVGTKIDGHELAPTMTTDAVATDPFDMLYRYLTQAKVPANYDKPTAYSNKITVIKPKNALTNKVDPAGKYDFYGPYKATYSALVEEGTKIQFTIRDNKNNDYKIVDSNFKDIKELGKDQQFYIAVNNKLTKGTVNVDLTVKNVTTFKPEGNRGKIFSPVVGVSQNVLVGGRTTQVDINGSFSQNIFKNVETGIQNIALLLMVTLVAFAVGYFVLSYKQKPVQLQK